VAAFNARQVRRRILEEIGREELRRVKGLIGSSTLRKAVRLIVEAQDGEARLFIPHYWAEFYHDGHGRINPVNARKLVFFANPADDPRKPTPERASQLRRLTRDEYQAGLEENRRRREAGQPPFMYVLDSTGPAGAHPFFDQLAQGAARRAGAIALRVFDEEIQRAIEEDDAIKPQRRTARFDF
jgi:hypothetical protein